MGTLVDFVFVRNDGRSVTFLGGADDMGLASAGCPPCMGGAAKLDADSAKALAGLTTTTDECAEDIEGRAPGGPCASRRMIEALSSFIVAIDARGGTRSAAPSSPLLPSAETPESRVVREAASILGCGSESCVIAHPDFRQYIVAIEHMPKSEVDLELETRFKAAGPRNTTALTSNYDLDGTLMRWARVFSEFYPCPYTMMDFERTGTLFARIDLRDVLSGTAPLNLGPGFGVVRRPSHCFGCILNTDVSSGDGKHWVAVFVDCRPDDPATPWTVEYFNSVGNPPPKAVVRWMESRRAQLAAYRRDGGPVESVPVSSMDHQESQTECGLYALYFIRRRLEGTPYLFFREQLVPDAAMTAFRAHVFRAS